MKNTTYRFSGLCIITAIALGACNYTEDYKKDGDQTVVDTASVSRVDNTRDLQDQKDTANVMAPIESSSASVASASPEPAPAMEKPSTATSSRVKKYKTYVAMPERSSSSVMVADKEGVYNTVQIMPQFPGGHKALENYLNNHIDYPDQAINDDAAGIIKVSFVVDENGKVQDAHVTGGDKVGDGVGEEAVRTVQHMPSWKPGKIHGQNVKTRLELPINFKLNT